jgi:hypothetical protein
MAIGAEKIAFEGFCRQVLKRTVGAIADIKRKDFTGGIAVMERESAKRAMIATADTLPALLEQQLVFPRKPSLFLTGI